MLIIPKISKDHQFHFRPAIISSPSKPLLPRGPPVLGPTGLFHPPPAQPAPSSPPLSASSTSIGPLIHHTARSSSPAQPTRGPAAGWRSLP